MSQSSSLLPLYSTTDGFQPSRGNLWTPPLLFRRRPPQSNCPPDSVPAPVHGARLEFQYPKGGIPTATPHPLTRMLLCLPPILYNIFQSPIPSYSKALRGLSVQSRVTRIFTHTPISPGPLLRQLSSRYAIHAGQNLPDKEFRYLRTVIVTAAVHWGLNSTLRLR